LGEKVGWHVGFGSAAVGMVLGLTGYLVLGPRLLGQLGMHPERAAAVENEKKPLTRDERDRLSVLVVFALFAVLFWAAFEQAGGLVNLFTQRNVERHVGSFEVRVTWFQAAQPAFILLLGPLFAALWQRLTRLPGGGPTTAQKMAFGLLAMGIGLVPLLGAARQAEHGLASLYWILGYYLLGTVGELSLSPVGLSAVTRLSPSRLVSRMMGVSLLSIGAGGYLAGYLGGMADRVGIFALYRGLLGALLLASGVFFLLNPMLRRMTHGADEFEPESNR
jgi:POT family proton-dependent oligopeptide transporter